MSKLALCAVLALAVAGCQGSQAGTGPGTTGSETAGHTSGGQSASAPARSAATRSAAPGSAAAEPTAAGLANVYVVADCAAAAPHSPSREPVSITLACADAGIGVQDMLWSSWAAQGATGSGLLWEKLCVPDCATGKMGYYPVDVTLSGVRASAKGRWFSALRVSWRGSRPPNQTPDTFTLMPPS